MDLLEKPEAPTANWHVQSWVFLTKVFSYPVLLAALLLLATFLVTRMFHVDPDTWLHDVVGQRILSTHSWPTSDPYSFTASGTEWIAYEWLAEVVLAGVLRIGGLRGWMGLLIGLASCMTLLIYYYAYLRCRNSKAAFVATALVLPLAGVWFTLHPQLFGYVFLVITLICLEHFRQGRRWALWLLPVVFLLWVNTHGTFVIGFLALGIYWLGGLVNLRVGSLRADRRPVSERIQLLAVALVSLLACCVTPYGTRLLTYPEQIFFLQPGMTAAMVSWQPIPFNLWNGQLFLAFVLLFIAALVVFQPLIRIEELALLVLAVVMTAFHARAFPLFAIVFAPLLAALLDRWVPNYEPRKDLYILNAFFITCIALGIVKGFPSRKELERTIADENPQGAVDYLRRHPQPRPMLNSFVWGGYLLYSLGAEQRVFIDCRIDIYEYTGVLNDYFEMLQVSPDTPWLLQKYHLRSCLISSGVGLATLFEASPDWKKVYGDKMCALFVRRDGSTETSKAGKQGKP
jgi:hypothetical protein